MRPMDKHGFLRIHITQITGVIEPHIATLKREIAEPQRCFIRSV